MTRLHFLCLTGLDGCSSEIPIFGECLGLPTVALFGSSAYHYDLFPSPTSPPSPTATRNEPPKAKTETMKDRTCVSLFSRRFENRLLCHTLFPSFDTPRIPMYLIILGCSRLTFLSSFPLCLFWLLPEASPPPSLLQYWRSSLSMKEPACCSMLAGDMDDR
ncbi:hypothetical protein BJX76DRAFT_341720 [Aspergillus varians]